MTTTPNSPQELFELNNQPKGVSPQQVLEVVEQLTPVQTIHVTRLLLNRLENFHWEIVNQIQEGESQQPLQPWVHDSTLLSNVSILFNNLTDFHQEDD